MKRSIYDEIYDLKYEAQKRAEVLTFLILSKDMHKRLVYEVQKTEPVGDDGSGITHINEFLGLRVAIFNDAVEGELWVR